VCICADVDGGLPFPDGSLSAVFCSDAVHYLVHKATVFRELQRAITAEGLILLASVRNALVEQLHEAHFLPPDRYRALLGDIPHRIVSDSSILNAYRRGHGPALARSDPPEVLRASPLITLVASHRATALTDHGAFSGWPHAEGTLEVNPLYARSNGARSGITRLDRVFPSPHYEAENAECKGYLPDTVKVPDDVLRDAAAGRRTPDVDALIAQCVLLGLPERFR
jgi:hypothetical protein